MSSPKDFSQHMTSIRPPEPVTVIAGRLTAMPAPVVLLDTCAILDIVRASYRKDASRWIIPAAKHLHYLASCIPQRIWVVVTSQVIREFARHKTEECAACRNAIDALDATIGSIGVAIMHISEPIPGGIPVRASSSVTGSSSRGALARLRATGSLIAWSR